MSEVDLSGKSDAELRTIVENHERLKKFGTPLLLAALAELAARKGGDLNPDRTIALVREQARQGLYVTYKEVAEASGRTWDEVRWKVFDHLGHLSIKSLREHGILLSAVVVAEPHRVDGLMEGETLRGFVRLAALAGLPPAEDEVDFLRAEQAKVFDWATERAEA